MTKIDPIQMTLFHGGSKVLQCSMITIAAGVTTTLTVGGGAFLFGFAGYCWASYIDTGR